MYKVKINYIGKDYDDLIFETELPKIPTQNEKIGFYHGEDWVVVNVDYVLFELDENNKYLLAELNVKD